MSWWGIGGVAVAGALAAIVIYELLPASVTSPLDSLFGN
jgi:hypothetical protein